MATDEPHQRQRQSQQLRQRRRERWCSGTSARSITSSSSSSSSSTPRATRHAAAGRARGSRAASHPTRRQLTERAERALAHAGDAMVDGARGVVAREGREGRREWQRRDFARGKSVSGVFSLFPAATDASRGVAAKVEGVTRSRDSASRKSVAAAVRAVPRRGSAHLAPRAPQPRPPG